MSGLAKPSDVSAPVRDAGGDNLVPRDKSGRPRILTHCDKCDGSGKVPSEKTGKPIKCKGSCGPTTANPEIPLGMKYRSYTRTTTYIDVIEDKSNLQTWGERMVLIGVARDPKFLVDVLDLDERRDEKEAKDELNKRAKAAKILAGSEEKADKGTELHALSEMVDMKEELPPGISFFDVIDLDAYRRVTEWLNIVHMEKLVVHDEYGIGGTPDRVSELNVEVFQEVFGREMWEEHQGLPAPDGSVIGPDELMITDLKTGSVEYGGLKMAMQLSIYSRSKLYDQDTGERTDLGNINQKWGLIMHLPAGSGVCTLYWADLTLGWEAVEIARQVRSLRTRSSKALKVLASAQAAA